MPVLGQLTSGADWLKEGVVVGITDHKKAYNFSGGCHISFDSSKKNCLPQQRWAEQDMCQSSPRLNFCSE